MDTLAQMPRKSNDQGLLLCSNAGSTIKTLALNKQADNENWFIRLSVKSGGQQSSSIGVSLTKQEFTTLQVLARVGC